MIAAAPRGRASVRFGVALLLAASGGAMIEAQTVGTAQPPQTPTVAPRTIEMAPMPRVVLTAGRSTVLPTDFNITRIAITNPAVADAVVVAPREILIDGKTAGTISLIIWGDSQQRVQYDVVVEQPIPDLQQRLQALFPGEDIQVTFNEDATILSGIVSNTNVMLRAAEIARASGTKRAVINMLQVPGGSESQQVLLQVRFAEVNRRIMKELGLNLVVNRADWSARATTQQFPAPEFDDEVTGGLVFSDFLNLFFFHREEGIGGVMRALEQTGAFQSLAEPNLIAYNGQEASFLAGGEFPVPVVQSATGSVSVEFKEFGIRLTFTPTIAGDVIRLKVAPEVSALDFANGVTLGGFRIPALTTRRAQTDVELRDGQSFAIAGLLDNISQEDDANIPFLSKIPIIGTLFKSKAERAAQTELMVLITPRLVRPLDPDEVPPLPTRFKPFLPGGGVGTGLDDAGLLDAPARQKPESTGTEKKPPARQ